MSIVIKDGCFSYFKDSKDILSNINAEFSRDEITVLTGASGCGKSTLLYLCAGLYPNSAGEMKSGYVSVDGTAPSALPPEERCRLVGMMFQNPELQFCMDTVERELIFCLENICFDPALMDRKIDEALSFCEITHLKKRTLLSLSGGERQKVMLACTVALSPKWILLDEPFANIDDASALEIVQKLKLLHDERDVGILAVDHRLEIWQNIADTVRVMEKGSVLPEKFGISDFERLKGFGVNVGEEYVSDIAPCSPGEVLLEIKNLNLKRGKNEILRNLNASFRRGEIYAVLGSSGCGKSSFFGALTGIYKYKGQILFNNKDIRKFTKKDAGKIGFVTQNPQDQFIGETVRKEIEIGLKHRNDKESASEEILRSIKLWRYRDVSPYMLSQGQQRRLGVASLMTYNCQALICDEPTYAQDLKNTVAIMETLCRQARDRNMTLIFSTHDRHLAQAYADRIFALEGGRLNEIG